MALKTDWKTTDVFNYSDWKSMASYSYTLNSKLASIYNVLYYNITLCYSYSTIPTEEIYNSMETSLLNAYNIISSKNIKLTKPESQIWVANRNSPNNNTINRWSTLLNEYGNAIIMRSKDRGKMLSYTLGGSDF